MLYGLKYRMRGNSFLLQLFKSPLVLGCLLVLASTSVPAQWADTDTLFQYGVEAFQQGQFDEARLYLENARNQGLDSPSLSYNLGVVYYQLERYDEAAESFRQLLDTDSHALASYNLGLIALKQEDTGAAKAAFRVVIEANAAENLNTLAERQLARLGEPGLDGADEKRWFGYAALSGGYESNIGLFPDSARSDVSAAFFETVLAGNGYLWGAAEAGVRGDFGIYRRQYVSEQDFDSDVGQLAMSWVQAAGPGSVRLGAVGAWLYRGGSAQEQHARLLAEYQQGGCVGWFAAERCRIRFTAAEVMAEPEYDPYDGQFYRLDARYQVLWQGWKGQLDYRAEYNDRDDLTTSTEFYSLSPQRHQLEMRVSYPVLSALELGLSTGVRYSKYRDSSRLVVPGGTAVIRRSDTRLQTGLDARWSLGNGVALMATYDYKTNASNIDRYDYSNQSVDAGVEISF